MCFGINSLFLGDGGSVLPRFGLRFFSVAFISSIDGCGRRFRILVLWSIIKCLNLLCIETGRTHGGGIYPMFIWSLVQCDSSMGTFNIGLQ